MILEAESLCESREGLDICRLEAQTGETGAQNLRPGLDRPEHVILPPGVHQYRFVVDGQWSDDPACTQRAPNPFGGENMMRRVA